MAPLTRRRARLDGTPTADQVEHYRQRAGAGLIISEATQVSATAGGAYANTPGIHNDQQQQMWRQIAAAVHEAGGRIFVQLWHVGRVNHPDISGRESVGPSAIAADAFAHTPTGKKPLPPPRALELDEIAAIVNDFRAAARRAIDAGLDGVEVHSANGYLLHQFLGDDSNHRTDEYGGTPHHRARLTAEVVEAIADEIGADRVGVRLSPGHGASGMQESDTQSAYVALLERVSPLPLAYVHLLLDPADPTLPVLRKAVTGTLVLNTGFAAKSDFAELQQLVADGTADAVAVGRRFISNPDLVARLRRGAPLTPADPRTFYSAGPRGYTDYPSLPDHARVR